MFRLRNIILVQDLGKGSLWCQQKHNLDVRNKFSHSNLKIFQNLLNSNNLIENYLKMNRKLRRKVATGNSLHISNESQLVKLERKKKLTETDPKTTLHNYYVKIASIEKKPKFLLQPPIYCKYSWYNYLCTYKFNWPKLYCVTEDGFTKQEASFNAAKCAVSWLRKATIMDDYGNPLKSNNNNLLGPYCGQSVRTYCTVSNTDIKKIINENTEMEAAKAIFPVPKSVLHNCFHILSEELQRKDLIILPQFKFIKNKRDSTWACTYNLKWPEPLKFTQNGNTKQDASYKAALAALAWLQTNKKIGNDGKPIIYNKEVISTITKHTHQILVLDDLVETKLNNIGALFSNLSKHLSVAVKEEKVIENDNLDLENEWPEIDSRRFRQKFKGVNFYEVEEPTELPISQHKENIVNMLENNRVIIIRGEPGCGKSTRVPQYVLEAWAKSENATERPCRIVITQPRRIAAISLAERVASERSERVGNTVGYQVRLKSNFNNETGCILYCTTGILLRRIQSDPKLTDCSHIILDEAHERDVNTDLLMNLLRKALILNPHLKLLVMSATIDTTIFQDYFDDAKTLHIPGFTYPVKDHFLDDNNNSQLPKTIQMCSSPYPAIVHEDVASKIESIHRTKPEGAILCFLSGWDDILKVKNLLSSKRNMSVLCLHSRLQVWEQQKIFERPPHGIRKVILSTNIAETSVTIDDVVYVIDTGIHKEERFDAKKGVICIDNHWISKASATQRKGRAGRCRPGECYHLYPKSKYHEMESYSIPEILRTSLTKIVLDSKVYSNNVNAVDFLAELVCPPDQKAVTKAVLELKELEMLDDEENLTPLGKTVSEFQMSPKLSKAMINAVIFKCVTPIVDIATLFSSETALFSKDLMDKEAAKKAKISYYKDSDHLALMVLLEEWLNYVENNDYNGAEQFCAETGLVNHKLQTLQKLRNIHFDYLTKGLKSVLPIISDDFSDNSELVKGVLLSGVGTLLQYRNWDITKGRLKKTNVFITRHNQKATITSESVNSKKIKFSSNFLMHINETVSNLRHTTLVRETSVISPLSVLLFKNGTLEIEEIDKKYFSQKIPSDKQVFLKFKNSDIVFLCDKEQAQSIIKCRDALRACIQHYVYQLTQGGSYNSDINKNWQQILVNLNNMLNSENVQSPR